MPQSNRVPYNLSDEEIEALTVKLELQVDLVFEWMTKYPYFCFNCCHKITDTNHRIEQYCEFCVPREIQPVPKYNPDGMDLEKLVMFDIVSRYISGGF